MQLELELKDSLQQRFKNDLKEYFSKNQHWLPDNEVEKLTDDLDKLFGNYVKTIKDDVIKHMLDRTVLFNAFHDLCTLLRKYDEQFKWCLNEGILNEWTHRELFNEFYAIREHTFKTLTAERKELKEKLLTDANNEIALLKKEVNEAYELCENFKKIAKIDSHKKLIKFYNYIADFLDVSDVGYDATAIMGSVRQHCINKSKELQSQLDNDNIENFLSRIKYLDHVMKYLKNE